MGQEVVLKNVAKQVVADYSFLSVLLLSFSGLMLVLPQVGYRQNNGTLKLTTETDESKTKAENSTMHCFSGLSDRHMRLRCQYKI